jgi:hypothetical protein
MKIDEVDNFFSAWLYLCQLAIEQTKENWEDVKEAGEEIKDAFVDWIAEDKIREIKEQYAATTNEYIKINHKLQEEREKVIIELQKVFNEVGRISITDPQFFSKTASFLKGYTNFHMYVIASISYCRYQILELKISKHDSEELKTIVLGLIQAGFPSNLKKEIEIVWKCTDRNQVITTYHKYNKKLDKNHCLLVTQLESKFNNLLQKYAKLSLLLERHLKANAVV